jgi:hypothetical protein
LPNGKGKQEEGPPGQSFGGRNAAVVAMERTHVPDHTLTEATLALVDERVSAHDGYVILGGHLHEAPVGKNCRMHDELCRRIRAMGFGRLRVRALFRPDTEVYLALVPKIRPDLAIRVAAVRFGQDFVVPVDAGGIHVRWWDGRVERIADALTADNAGDIFGRFVPPGWSFRAVEYLPGGLLDGLGWEMRLKGMAANGTK